MLPTDSSSGGRPSPAPPAGTRSSQTSGSGVPGLRRFRLGSLEIDLVSGAIRRRDGSLQGRLAPQPAALLQLLASRAGEVVPHDEIRQHLWPEVTVDYETGLHFCVRQVRSALGDRANAPRFVETLPRRGYRLLETPHPLTPDEASEGDPSGEPAPPTEAPVTRQGSFRGMAWLSAALVLGFASLAVWIGSEKDGTRTDADALRIAILPVRPPAELPYRVDPRPLAELLLEDLGRLPVDRFEVVGPTTTAVYGGEPPGLLRLIADLEPDYLLHVRCYVGDRGPRLLAELIRASDKAHVLVLQFDDPEHLEPIAAALGAGVRQTLGASALSEPG